MDAKTQLCTGTTVVVSAGIPTDSVWGCILSAKVRIAIERKLDGTDPCSTSDGLDVDIGKSQPKII
jgi:hypothetical protein